MWLTPLGPCRATTCRGREVTQDHILFWPHKNMEGLPWWVIRPVPGPLPWQPKHERRDTPSTHPFILTRRRWKDDCDGQMIFGNVVGLNFLTFVLQVRKNPDQTSPWKRVPTGDRTRARCVTGAHVTACPTAVDAMLCYVMLCYATLRYVMLRYFISY